MRTPSLKVHAEWFDDNTWELEPTDDAVSETSGLSTALMQETHDREHAGTITKWERMQAAGPVSQQS
jgi:hypothetical protein